MKFKKIWTLGLFALAIVGITYAASGDIWSLRGKFTSALKVLDVIRLTNTASPDLILYNGDFVAGNSLTTPAITDGGHGGLVVYLTNASGGSVTQGTVVVPKNGAAGSFTTTTVIGTTTVLGIADETIANAATGRIKVAGLAVVNTTYTVTVGDLLVSTGPAGYAAAYPVGTIYVSSHTSNSRIGKALTAGSATVQQVVVKLD